MSSIKREIRHCYAVDVHKRQQNVQKKRDACAKLLFCFFKPIALFDVLVAVASSDLKVPLTTSNYR